MTDSELSYQAAVLKSLPDRDVLLVAVGVILTNERGALLLHRQADQLWHLPGGHVNPGEALAQAAIREMQEEMGVTPLDLSLWTVVNGAGAYVQREGRNAYYVTVLFRSCQCEGKLAAGEESVEVGWFALDALPTEMTGTVRQVAQVLRSGASVPVNFELQAGQAK